MKSKAKEKVSQTYRNKRFPSAVVQYTFELENLSNISVQEDKKQEGKC